MNIRSKDIIFKISIEMEKLTKVENKIVNLMHKGVDQEVIKMKLHLNDKNLHIYTRSIFKKLKVTNWINAFRISFHEINRDNLNQNESVNNYISKSVNNIKRLKKLKPHQGKQADRYLRVFDGLVRK